MDFDDTPDEAAYRVRTRTFLHRHATPKAGSSLAYRGRYSVDTDTVSRARVWQSLKAQHGFAGIAWPTAWGGQGLSAVHQVIYAEEEASYAVPQGIYEIGLAMCVPTVMRFGRTPDLVELAARALSGEQVWCQLFSEPGAGSDLASLSTRATPDGDGWIVNGQKTWTSVAHLAHRGLLLVRTNPSAPKHAGLTAFQVDMQAPGVTVRPIRQMSGESHFNDVFFDDVRIADDQRLGPVDGGWKVALSTLSSERFATGEAPGPHVGDLLTLVRGLSGDRLPEDTALREQLGDWVSRARGLKYARCRIITALGRGEMPGPEASIGKLVSSAMLQEIVAYGLDALGMTGGVSDPILSPMEAWFQNACLYAPATRVAGGTDEILRNIIAERVLDLPPEPRSATPPSDARVNR